MQPSRADSRTHEQNLKILSSKIAGTLTSPAVLTHDPCFDFSRKTHPLPPGRTLSKVEACSESMYEKGD